MKFLPNKFQYWYFLILGNLVFSSNVCAQTSKDTIVEVIFYDDSFHSQCLSEYEREEILSEAEKNSKKLHLERNISKKITSTSFGWPLRAKAGFTDPGYHVKSNFVDHDPNSLDNGTTLLDYNCGNRTYDRLDGYDHKGIDISLWPYSWNKMDDSEVEVIAAADGVIIGKTDGNFDRSCSMGGGSWNGITIQHADGSRALYGHMKNGSVTSKGIGASVLKGEYLGVVGSSGNSTGPHLHFEVYNSSNNLIDPFSGPCNSMNATSWWDSQPPYYESAVNKISTHSAVPDFGTCPNPAVKNEKNNFLQGETVFFLSFFREYLSGQVAVHRVYRPDNSVFSTFNTSSTASPFSRASYWWASRTLPAAAPLGVWRYEVVFEGITYNHFFNVVSSLPVVLLQFNVSNDRNEVNIEWSTSSEINNSHFEIQRSIDGIDFVTIGTIKGSGTSNQISQYSFKDHVSASGTYYYRLVQVDFNGVSVVSSVKTIQVKPEFRIYPIPASDLVYIEILNEENQDATIVLMDPAGRQLAKEFITASTHSINLEAFSKGCYILSIEIGEKVFFERILKY